MVIEEIRDLSFDRPKRLGACRRGIACGAKAIKLAPGNASLSAEHRRRSHRPGRGADTVHESLVVIRNNPEPVAAATGVAESFNRSGARKYVPRCK